MGNKVGGGKASSGYNSWNHGWETGSYLGDVGQMFVGYGRAGKNVVTGLWSMVSSPIQTAKGLGQAVMNPIDTYNAIIGDYSTKLQSNAGVGEIVGDVLIGIASGGVLKAADKAGYIAKISGKFNRVPNSVDAKKLSFFGQGRVGDAGFSGDEAIKLLQNDKFGRRVLGHLEDANVNLRFSNSINPSDAGVAYLKNGQVFVDVFLNHGANKKSLKHLASTIVHESAHVKRGYRSLQSTGVWNTRPFGIHMAELEAFQREAIWMTGKALRGGRLDDLKGFINRNY